MALTDQLIIIDNKIKANQAQYDLDRLGAKISACYSGDLRKYEYLAGEDLGYKSSVFEQVKRLENIKDKNKELLNAFSAANKVSKAAENESDFNYDFKYTFYKFYRDFKKFKRMSLGSKYDEMNDFYTLLNAFINTHEATTAETKDRKDIIMENVKQLYDKYLDSYKINYNSEKVKD